MSERDLKRRPDPDALLALAAKDTRGKLTVFLGAAPGVGKTYAMLLRAQRLKRDGVDIVVGLVETHGRSETAALVEGLDVLPRRSVSHRNRTIEEFDLDAALVRQPAIIVVDELAHSNAPGSRHPKRYQDIEELIAAGIDVWTALNIQHLESLSDLVTQITGAPVRERVPDTVLNRADEVLLVDLPPAELIERLNQGKVYLPKSAGRAVERFFRLGNLTALRELALRRTADRVDDQMVDYLNQNAVEGSWAISDKLIVCVGPDPLSEKVVRTASRLASGLNAPWIVVFLERSDREPGDGAELKQIDEIFALAERLGAETRRISGNDFADEILKLARREHATQIVIGARHASMLRRPFRRSLPDALLARATGIAVHLVTDAVTVPSRVRRPILHPSAAALFRSAAFAVGLVSVATALGMFLGRLADLPNVSLLFLMSVLVSAVYAGYGAAFSAAIVAALSYNFFFIPPTNSFTIASPHEVFGLLIFFAAALLAGSLASRIREQASASRDRAAAIQALYDFSRKLSGTTKSEDVLWAAVTQVQASLKRSAVLLLPNRGDLQLTAVWPPDTELDVSDMTAARWALEKNEKAGSGTATLPNSPFQFRPLGNPTGVVGVCGIRQQDRPIGMNEERTLAAILDLTAIAIDRARLDLESIDQAAKLEAEHLREALLSSISHDLRTPLATITGSVTSLRQLGEKMSKDSRDDLLASIEEESGRLSRFVSNLLDMTRIESGMLSARRDWIDVADVVRAAVNRARSNFPGREIETSIAPDLPLLRGDSVLLGQVFFNLLDNAHKYGGDEPISVFARVDGDEVMISLTDLGRGIPPHELTRIFDKFYRRGKADGRAPGTGLGLSISRGFIEAMGGRIKAESPALRRRGTRIVMRFPVEHDSGPKGKLS